MPEFLELLSPSKAIEKFFEHYLPHPESELIETINALNRVTHSPIVAPHPLPMFIRSTVDGYAVRASDTFGASGNLPAYLQIAGEIQMGSAPDFDIESHQCALIHTGGMLPVSADAVVMIEHTQRINDHELEVLHSVAPNENVIQIGEDVSTGEEVLPSGALLASADIGGLLALGITELLVAKRPRVGILSSGDELVNPENDVNPGQVRDINSFSLNAFVEQHGCVPVRYGIIADEFKALLSAAQKALEETELLIFTAGSSASTRDLTAQVINKLGSPGVLVHGINIRPGKPTILAVCAGKAVIGLPGNPVSALIIADRILTEVFNALLGLDRVLPRPRINARLLINLSSQSGREDWVPVRLIYMDEGLFAEPVFGKSNLIFTLSRADGLVCIPADANGLNAGEYIDVFYFK